MKQPARHTIAILIEHELLVLLAIVLLLGVLFGCSLAAAKTTTGTTTLQPPTQTLRSTLGTAGDDID